MSVDLDPNRKIYDELPKLLCKFDDPKNILKFLPSQKAKDTFETLKDVEGFSNRDIILACIAPESSSDLSKFFNEKNRDIENIIKKEIFFFTF